MNRAKSTQVIRNRKPIEPTKNNTSTDMADCSKPNAPKTAMATSRANKVEKTKVLKLINDNKINLNPMPIMGQDECSSLFQQL